MNFFFFRNTPSRSLQTKTQDPFFSMEGESTFLREGQQSYASQQNPFFSPAANQTVSSSTPPGVQAKLKIGQPNDPQEKEADLMGERVLDTSKAEPKIGKPSDAEPGYSNTNTPNVQKKCADCEKEEKVDKKEEEQETPIQEKTADIQTKPIFESNADQNLQTKSENGTASSNTANSALTQQLSQNKGKGEPLPEETQGEMENTFGADFSGVKIHTGSAAEDMNQGLQAKAFTHGSDIYFNKGQYNPDSRDGKRLLGHELTHVVQQGKAGSSVQKQEVSEGNAPTDDPAKELQQSEQEAQAAKDFSLLDLLKQKVEEKKKEGGKDKKGEKKKDKAAPKGKETPKKGGKGQGKAAKPAQKPPTKIEQSKELEQEVGEAGKEMLAQSEQVCQDAANQTQDLANNEQAHDSAGEKLKQTEDAVQEPAEEGQSRNNANQVEKVEQAPAPPSDPEGTKATMEQAINDSVPSSVKKMNEFKSQGKAQVIGTKVMEKTTKEVNAVQDSYKKVEESPQAAPPPQAETMPETEAAPETANMNLGKDAVPDVNEAQLDTTQYSEESDALMEKEGISEEQLEMVDKGPLAEAKENRKELKKKTEEEPAQIREMATEKQNQVEADMQAEEQQAKTAMKKERQAKLQATKEKQQKTKSDLEIKREQVTQHINQIYEKAKATVQQKLATLEDVALAQFDFGQKRFSQLFEDEVNRDIRAWKRKRYSGLLAGAKWLRDKFLGIDDFPEVKAAFDNARARYVTRIDSLILKITQSNQKTIEACKLILQEAKTQIKTYVNGLGPELKATGRTAMRDMRKKLAEMDQFIEKKKEELNEKLCKKKEEAIKAIDKKIEEMKASMSGLVSILGNLLLEALLKFFKWALEKIGSGGDQIMGIINKGKAVIKKIVGDPVQFFKNLGNAVSQGFKQFIKNIKKHLIKGLITWLTGAMGDVGITLPEKFDLKGILSIVLQIFGLTYSSIRAKLVKHVGEKVVSMAEKGFEIIKRVREEGPMALWNMLMEKIGEIKQKIMDGIRNWIVTQIVKKASIKLLSMLNPAGAIFQAIMAIYDVVMFFINNWDQIVSFVKSIFDSVGEIAFGRLGKAAAWIENALGKTIPIILNFLGRFLGLSGIGKAIKSIIEKVRKPVDKILDKVIGFIVKQIKKLFGKGKGGKKKEEEEKENDKGVKGEVRKELKSKLKGKIKDAPQIKGIINQVYKKYNKKGLKKLDVELNKNNKFDIKAKASPISILIGDIEHEFEDSDFTQWRTLSMQLNPTIKEKTFLFVTVNGEKLSEFPIKSETGVEHAETKFLNNYFPNIVENARQQFDPSNPGNKTNVSAALNRSACSRPGHMCAQNLANAQRSNSEFIQFNLFFAGPHLEKGEVSKDPNSKLPTLSSDAEERIIDNIYILLESGANVSATKVWTFFKENHPSPKVRNWYAKNNEHFEKIMANLIERAKQKLAESKQEKERIDSIEEGS